MKFLNKAAAIFATLLATISPIIQANDLVNDPFIRQATSHKSFEPGGQYHLFGGARGSVADRDGKIIVLPTSTQNLGSLKMEQAIVSGNVSFKTKFSGHHHDEHAPFSDYNSVSKSDTQGQALIGFTTYKLNVSGTKIHPADGYDGEQGSGYPEPTGARDEYYYGIGGSATRVSVDFNDSRPTDQRFLDRFSGAWNTATNGLSNAWNTATTHNPDLNRAGNAAEAIDAAMSGIGSLKDAGFEAIGAGDAYQGLSTLKAIAGMEALRSLPAEAQMQAVAGLTSGANAYDGAVASYDDWAARNPNKAVVVGAVANVAEQAISRGGKNSSSVDEFSTKRPTSFRNDTVKNAWDNAENGSEVNTKKCPTCGNDVRGNPHNKESRNTDEGWDVSHNPSWNNRDHSSYGSRKELLDDYNQGTGLECRHCNRSGQDNDERFNKE